ncbi:T9SS sorting signal type C domain-containing protein [Flavobacterium sp. MMS24-S5]|uniref:T9SS sorting signal type C domain-containing protein n=1 Tax=Flavobacterium sp. MMS24-S5 TaxID=3416605 RepID=UPI003CFD384D
MMRKLLYSFLFLFFAYSSFAQIVFTDNTPGTRSWAVPQGATQVTVEIWGAGGAGGGSRNNNVGGSGGGGGGYSLKTFSVTAGQNISYTIGSGGTGSTGNGTAGGATTLTYTASNSLLANGGARGIQNNGATTGGAGGTASGGTTNLPGSNGSSGSNIGGNGGNSGNTPNTGGAGGVGANGASGIIPGGGGGGGERAGSDRSGGAGANGQVRITYTPSYQYQIISSNTGSTTWCAGETRNVSVTIKNTGSKAWTDTPSSDFNIGIKWNTNGTSWTDYNVRVDAGNLAPGDTKTYTFTITATNSGGATDGTPLAAGINNLTFDVVYELVAWFGDNHSGVRPGNAVLKTGDQTIVASPLNRTISVTSSPVCSGSGTTINVANSELGVSYQLRNGSTNIGTPVAGSNGTISLPTGNLTTDTTFNVLATSACGSSLQMSNTSTVNVTPLPTPANAGSDQIGNSASFTLAANAPTVGTGAWSVANGPSTSASQFNSTTSRTATFTPAVLGTYVLNWTITNGGCTSTDQVVISTCVTNLIKNGDFSNGTTDWTRATTKGSYVEVYDESVYFGNSNNTNITAELDSQASLGQNVTVVPGVTYTLSFLYARRTGSSPTTAVDFKIIDGSNTISRTFTTNDTTNTPVFISFPFTPTSSSIWIEFYNSLETTTLGSIIDNIALIPSSQVVPIATTTPKGTYKTLEACEGVPIQLDVENVSASGVTYSWTSTSSGVTFSSPTAKNPTITCTGTGIKNATVVVTTAGGCPSSPSTTYVNIKAAPTVYNVTGGGSYCSGGTGVAVGLSNSTTGVSYQLKLNGNNSGSPMSGTTGSAINFGLKTTAGTYTVVATNASPNSCSLNMNGSAVITVDPVSVGGSISGSTTVCLGTNSTTLTLSGHTGSVTKWQSSPSNTFSPVTDIPNSANTSLIVSNLTATTYYRAVVKSGTCSSADSGTGTVTVNPNNTVSLTSAVGTNTQTVCINTPISNITYSTNGATSATVTGLPAGVIGGWSGNVVTISGTPTESSATPYTYTVTLNGGCGTVTTTGTIRVNPINTVSLTSAAGTNAQTACINTPISNITYSTTGATSATVTGLPDGVTGSWSGNVVTISGTPTVSSATPYSYTVTLNGGCGTVTATGTIRVNPINTIALTSGAGTNAQSICFNSAITDITYATTGGNVVMSSGFPTGLNIAWSGSVLRISGTPNVSSASPYNYTVALQGACETVTLSGTITVKPIPTTPTITKNNDAACNTLGSITITGLSGNWTVNQTGVTALPKSYPGPGASLAIQDLAADTYSFTVTNNDTGCTSSAVTVTITDTSSNTDWGPSGWTNGEPDGSKSVTISSLANGQPFSLAKPNITACSLTITVGSDVIIPSGVTLEITNKVTSNGKLVFESGSSLIQTTNVQNSGDIVYKRATSIRRFDLTYWSSPITSTKQDGFMMKDLSPETLFDKYSYWSSSFKWATDLYGNMEMKPGIGYSIRGPQSFSIETPAEFIGKFSGIPNNGDIPISTTPDKYLLIGNPYPSAIDGRKFITDNGDVGALYFWTHVSLPKKAEGSNTYRYSSPDYAVFTLLGATRATTGGETPSGYIGVGQGFFIKPKVTSIKFNNGQRVKAENSQFFKTTAKEAAIEVNRLWLNLSNTDDAYKQILIGYAEGATNSFDYNYDAVTLAGNTYVDFYTINEAQKLSIQARSLPFDNTERIPLGYKSVAETQLTISIDHADGFFNKQAVYLEDKTTGTITDLRATNYTFKTGIGTFTDRFVLRYTNKTLGTDDIESLENSVLISVKNKTVSITCSKETIKDVTIFNVGGQLVYSKYKVNSSELQITNLHSSDQVLLVKVTLENGSIITKKVIFSNL